MRITRIFQEADLICNKTVFLDERARHHLSHVLRFKNGDCFYIFNREGAEYKAIYNQNGREVSALLTEKVERKTESPLHIHLVQGLARGDKMDFIIQKAIELGVNQITPIFTEYSNVKLAKERQQNKLDHWRNIVIHALEQSNRNIMPIINPICTLPEFLKKTEMTDETFKIVLHPHGQLKFTKNKQIEHIIVIIGPEGGFSDAEINLCERFNVNTVCLGPRILRTETASIAALSTIQAIWGDFLI